MKSAKWIVAVTFALVLFAATTTGRADDAKAAKPKPYPLDTCLVCGMKLSDMGKPYIFVYKGQEIKVCDKSEKADFDKAPDKFTKKLVEAEAKLKK